MAYRCHDVHTKTLTYYVLLNVIIEICSSNSKKLRSVIGPIFMSLPHRLQCIVLPLDTNTLNVSPIVDSKVYNSESRPPPFSYIRLLVTLWRCSQFITWTKGPVSLRTCMLRIWRLYFLNISMTVKFWTFVPPIAILSETPRRLWLRLLGWGFLSTIQFLNVSLSSMMLSVMWPMRQWWFSVLMPWSFSRVCLLQVLYIMPILNLW
jgi:hypothetical protein